DVQIEPGPGFPAAAAAPPASA
ncbi:MAG: hypothetical protein QOJ46_956, partial [bacterium]